MGRIVPALAACLLAACQANRPVAPHGVPPSDKPGDKPGIKLAGVIIAGTPTATPAQLGYGRIRVNYYSGAQQYPAVWQLSSQGPNGPWSTATPVAAAASPASTPIRAISYYLRVSPAPPHTGPAPTPITIQQNKLHSYRLRYQ